MRLPPDLRPSRQDVDRARHDLSAFGTLTGWPMEPWQSQALSLRTRQTILVSPRQCGKSRSLAVLACWWAFRRPNQVVLVISAGEVAAGRLLAAVRGVASHPLLHGSVTDETKTWVVLSNGSQIRCVPASDAQIRGWSVDLLIVDEASFIPDGLLASAAIPTTAARPEARLVFASTPWGDSGMFYSLAMAGLEPDDVVTRTYRWKLADAWWIVPEVIEAARKTLSPLQFRAEYEGEWVGAGNAYFSRDDLLAAVCDFPLSRTGHGAAGVAGLDWGRQQDAHAIAVSSLLDDYGVNGRPVVIVPWIETSRRTYAAQVSEIEDLARHWQLTVLSETVGVGAHPSEEVARRLTRSRVIGVHTSQQTKETAYGRAASMLSERSLVLPQHEETLRQMLGVAADPTPMGGLRIGARLDSVHDDIPDAISLAIGGLPRQLAEVPSRPVPDGITWRETPGGVRVPLPMSFLAPEASYLGLYGGVVKCPSCQLCYPAGKAACQFCQAPNPAAPPPAPAAAAKDADPAPVANMWAPDLMECPAGHKYLAAYSSACPACGPGGAPRPGGQGMPAGVQSLLRRMRG